MGWAIVHRHDRHHDVVPNSDPCQINTHQVYNLLLPGLWLGVGEGLGLELGLGLGIQIAISMRGVIIWQGIENGYNTGIVRDSPPRNPPHPNTVFGQKMMCFLRVLKLALGLSQS